jgi:6-phosphofructo-2-kinase/fructose-2,6-biphosphatase
MGNSRSVEMDSGTDSSNSSSSGGSQLFVSLRLHCKLDGETLPLGSVPYVTGSIPIVGLWEISKAVSSLIHTHKP